MGEALIVHEVAGDAASVLDLGCGTGRVAHELLELGHEVLGVDESAEMPAQLRGVRAVRARIADLDLDRTFEVVLLASHLINVPDDGERAARLASAARHLETGGRLVAEWHPPEWFDEAREGVGRAGDVRIELRDVRRDGDLLSAAVVYRLGDETWRPPLTQPRPDPVCTRCGC